MSVSHALIIGIEEYREFERVPFARADADAMYHHLWEAKYDAFEPERCTLLTDAEATNTNIRRALRELFERRCAPGDSVLVYFAGHGVFDTTGGYLIPADLPLDADLSQGISFDLLDKFVTKAKPGTFVLLVDTCHSGEIARVLGERSARDIELSHNSQAESIAGEGRVILSSCGTGQKAYSDDELGHGVFTHYLLEALNGGTAEHPVSCPVSAYTMVDHVKRRVVQHGRDGKLGRIQAPQDFIKTSGMIWLPSSPGPGGEVQPFRPATIETHHDKQGIGAVRITSKPSDARVIFDGEEIDRTPVTHTSVQAGAHDLWLELDGYEPWRETIQVVSGKVEEVSVGLEPIIELIPQPPPRKHPQQPSQASDETIRRCPNCGSMMSKSAPRCLVCGMPFKARKRRHRTKGLSTKAVVSLMLGAVSIPAAVIPLGMCCVPIIGTLAIISGYFALNEISSSAGKLRGASLAVIGIGLGALGVIAAVALGAAFRFVGY